MNYGRYQIVKEVGRGSMGVVYEAQDPTIGRIVAVKVLRQDRITTETFVKRFLKEAKVIGRLSHPNIVTIHDVGEDHGTVYIAMEYLEGTPLFDIIKDKHLETRELVDIGIQIAETLEYAHQKGVIHRDIKPSNIIVLPDNRIKITDFGIAHIDDPSSTIQTQVGEVMGTPAYMSPEQVQGQPIDGRSDIFSLGVILYEMSTGQRPFGKGKSLATIFNEIMLHTPEEPFRASPLIPHKLSDIIMKALSKDPDARFQSGREMADALHKSLAEKQPVEIPTHFKSPATMKYSKPVIVIITLVIIAVGVFFFLQDRKLPPQDKPLQQPVAKPVTQQVLPPSLPPASTAPDKKAVQEKLPENSVASPPSKPVSPPIPSTPKPATIPTPVPVVEPATPRIEEVKPKEQLPATAAIKPLPKFAFLTVKTVPKGADVYINGNRKGITPLTLKLGLGEYKVRISSPGYQDSEKSIILEKMTGYPLNVKLKPIK
jgi:serine/threonine-protein kinase